MAKIFYTIDEACAKLGKNNGQVMDLIKSGKLREFRDRGQLMLKVEDVNSIATDIESDDGLDLKMGSDMVNLGGESDSFELDLTDSASPATLPIPRATREKNLGKSLPRTVPPTRATCPQEGRKGDASGANGTGRARISAGTPRRAWLFLVVVSHKCLL